MNKPKKIEVGDVYKTNQGCEALVIEYNGCENVVVEVGGIKKRVTSQNLRNGEVKNPHHPSVCGVGYVGVGEWEAWVDGKHSPEYRVWNSMMKRAYSSNTHSYRPSYRDAAVCKEWHNFQNFAEWMSDQPNAYKKGFHLDKDLMVLNSRQYSPETCSFVHHSINTLLNDSGEYRGDLPIGVSRYKEKYKTSLSVDRARVVVGVYETVELAQEAYKEAKEKNVKRMAAKYKDSLHPRVYQNLITWEVV